jgi:hypothetical protein
MSVSSDTKRTVRKVTAGEAEIDPAAEVCAADEKKSKKQLLDDRRQYAGHRGGHKSVGRIA